MSDKSMEILLPNYKNVYSQIKEIRQNSKILKENLKNKELKCIVEKEPEFVKHHNNVFSILGERGSGKTSVLLTIKHKIMQIIEGIRVENGNEVEYEGIENDIVLPIIVPQDMDEDSDSLGWIIGFFAKLVDEVEYEFQNNINTFEYKENMTCSICKNEQYSVRKEKINYVKEAFQEVKKSYFLRKDEYKKSLTDVGAKTEYVDLNAETLSKDIQLSSSFKKFIDEYIEYKMNQKRNQQIEPLIYIFFDDVDISTKKCLNVLETIIRFLSHSNIVIFVSGNYTTFEETIVINYLEQDGILNSKLLENNFSTEDDGQNKNALKIRQELAYDYLKKVLSPALRYELKKIENEDKMNFKYNSEDSSEEYETLYQLIQKNFGLNDGQSSFLTYESINEDKKYIPISTFFNSFEDKPRGLMNIYYYLNSMKKIIEEKKHEGKKVKEEHSYLKEIWTCEELNHLLDIIIDSSSKLNMHKKKIKSLIRIQNLESKNEIEVDVRYNGIIKIGIIDENLKLELITLGMFFDGIYCSLYKDKIKEYSNNFVKIKEYDEISEIKDFLNSKIFEKENFPMEIIHKMKNPFEMLYVFGIAKKYPLNIETEKEQILILTKILKHVSSEQLEMNSEKLERNEEQIEIQQITNYINKKNIYDTYWLENLKKISKKASQFLIFEINEELRNLLSYYYLLDKNYIEKQNENFLEVLDYTWELFKEKIKEIKIIEQVHFDTYFEIKENEFNENAVFEKKEKLKAEIEKSIEKNIKELEEIYLLKNEIREIEQLIKGLKEKYEKNKENLKIEDEIQEIVNEKKRIEENLHANKVSLREFEKKRRNIEIELIEEENRIQGEKNKISEKIRSEKYDLERIQLEANSLELKQKEEMCINIKIKIEQLELNWRTYDVEINRKTSEMFEKIEKIEIEFGKLRKMIQGNEERLNELNGQIRQNEELKMEMNKIEQYREINEEEEKNKNIILEQKIDKFEEEFSIAKNYRTTIQNIKYRKKINAIFSYALDCLNTDMDMNNNLEDDYVIFQIEKNLQHRLERYRRVNEYNDIIKKLREMIRNEDKIRKEIFKYLGQSVECEFIINQGDFNRYDYKEINKHYLINLLIILLINNKFYEKKITEYNMNNIEIALKKKDEELKNRYGFIKISDGLKRDLMDIKRRIIQYRNFPDIDGNKMYVEDFIKMKKEIEFDLAEERDRIFRNRKQLENILYNMDNYEIEEPKIKEILQYRAYALLYAIIKKETRKTSDYEKTENFYKKLNKILDANDIELKKDMFKLDI